jgi:hypothetical protein
VVNRLGFNSICRLNSHYRLTDDKNSALGPSIELPVKYYFTKFMADRLREREKCPEHLLI